MSKKNTEDGGPTIENLQEQILETEALVVKQVHEMEEMRVKLEEAKMKELELEKKVVKAETERNNYINRSLKISKKLKIAKLSPELAIKMAEMEYELQMAERFVKSGAFPKMTPEQAYTIMRAGGEMGLKHVESLQTLYIVNGCIKPYGDKMLAKVLSEGYNVKYDEETSDSVKVIVSHPESDEVYIEVAHKDDKVLKNSKAMGFAPKNKLRFHGIRMIVSFYLPHLFNSVSDMFTEDYHSYREEERSKLTIPSVEMKKERYRVLEHIKKAKSREELEMVQAHKAEYDVVEEYDEKLKEFLNSKKSK